MTVQSRQRAGIPAGGQFAATEHAEAVGVDLATAAPRPAPLERIEVPASAFRASWMPATDVVELANPVPHPRIGCDWTDPTRDLEAFADVRTSDVSSERQLTVRALKRAVRDNLDASLDHGRVPPAAAAELDAWERWSAEQFAETGDSYYSEFHDGLRAGRVAFVANQDLEGSGWADDALTAWENDEGIDSGVAAVAERALLDRPLDDGAWASWEGSLSLASSAGSQDGALMVGRTIANIGRPAVP